MIKALFTALTGIDESIDNDDYQDAWQRQKFLDENDLDVDDDDDDDSDRDDDDDDTPKKWWQI
ncbi:hypothetical protein H6F44_20575 [Pseudanabaena sp. FACHB-1277]|uniref:Uncharacterized protein n=1 Tax=Pseudanabaena cinerea FACHB-1277 TaxID=2949581 RepID=A0A926Z897_9CYAN|nr:hypothetical protein [Pseudanabaena cinerea]MBD2152493.1 hypothetical protein [Pseudanabaena cinerea FACHB-1277]